MKIIRLLFVSSLIALFSSCNMGLMDDSSFDMDSFDWESVDNNVFLGDNNEPEFADGDLILYICAREKNLPGYYLRFITSSENYFVQIKLDRDYPFPIDKKGNLCYKHMITSGKIILAPKKDCSSILELSNPIIHSCIIMIDCDVKQKEGYKDLVPGSFGDNMEGDVQIKISTENRDLVSFSFNKLIPFLNTEWKQGCEGDKPT